MIAFVGVATAPWVFSILLRLFGDRLDRHLSPGWAVVGVSALSALSAAAVVASSIAVSAVLLSASSWPPRVAGAVLAIWLVWRVAVSAMHLRRVAATARRSAPFGRTARATDGVVVVESSDPDAFAVPSGGGAIVMTTALMSALSDAEIGAVLDHERAHLRYRHAFWTQAAEVSALLDPFARPVVARVRHAAERHADECAADAADRTTVMTALARAALLRADVARDRASYTVSGTGGDVVARARALSGPPPVASRGTVVVACAVVAAALISLVVVLADVTQDVIVPEAGESATTILE
ncbi:hypothetical protein ASG56_03160 [Rhodococcus sp. Leaf7]|uniref:M56 family metallopeptidase n=1 Tax=unclassified Rhodococcus (in: high G+C Gram-positive bacteria) TaxID=192944 RepID=UPI0006FED528|nr:MULTISPECIES: M56 family metallopeptidase [unclassified Rhodococcus (in: high G+C Gram-positive bacteria)]KQU06658.1 hypothetical protein ASG56_03160 [Rhodococcus sp. Leaf7]KQU42178.1 hypothetical protein ASG64_03160 [Rhodococcus sp. Leaf247]